MSSLQDQLLKAGLVDKKQAKKAKKDKVKQQRVQNKSSQPQVDENKALARKAQAEKAERDRQLNAERDAQAMRKAIAAQIKQLVNLNAVKREGDVAYNFTDGKTIKKIYVSQKLVDQLARGQLAIASVGEEYQVIPAKIADKIAERDASFIVSQASNTQAIDEDDPYADYQIPDDLMW
ncbi:DUF2058 domain-containing protein [Teredinibacter turnerae]|uniref:DUF2058 domain-containing protein n=1 Tax=Teredinibacter turnerae TaxID=2426 RepID=UPI000377AC88|nr:DUF2058 domain-containing protein [Teredinibacter turnerae]